MKSIKIFKIKKVITNSDYSIHFDEGLGLKVKVYRDLGFRMAFYLQEVGNKLLKRNIISQKIFFDIEHNLNKIVESK